MRPCGTPAHGIRPRLPTSTCLRPSLLQCTLHPASHTSPDAPQLLLSNCISQPPGQRPGSGTRSLWQVFQQPYYSSYSAPKALPCVSMALDGRLVGAHFLKRLHPETLAHDCGLLGLSFFFQPLNPETRLMRFTSISPCVRHSTRQHATEHKPSARGGTAKDRFLSPVSVIGCAVTCATTDVGGRVNMA
ncbi:hypothetical protein CC78DRAFT_354702 [Lojkania enalia]|uniref:Uncharacterized protein n=1 Tax=Lojkania enalia TaxID=147567 RepID=A0A9P4N6U4_9PLEO|nr:hypothetical protein CC78DRAFT_354702 [Didymosphaeria enalia]